MSNYSLMLELDKEGDALEALRRGLPTITDCNQEGRDEQTSMVDVLMDSDELEKHLAALLSCLRIGCTDEHRDTVARGIAEAIGTDVGRHIADVGRDLEHETRMGAPR